MLGITWKMAAFIGIACIAFGCSHNSFWKKTRSYAGDSVILPVAGKLQKENRCGANSLAILFEASGSEVTEEQIAKAIHNPRLDGALSIDLVLYARSQGFPAEFYTATLEDLKDSLRRGVPCLLMLKLTSRHWWPFSRKREELMHFVVAYGLSEFGREIYIHSGVGKKRMSFRQLDNAWKQTGYWMMNLGVSIPHEDGIKR